MVSLLSKSIVTTRGALTKTMRNCRFLLWGTLRWKQLQVFLFTWKPGMVHRPTIPALGRRGKKMPVVVRMRLATTGSCLNTRDPVVELFGKD